MCFPLEVEKSGGSTPRSFFMILTKVSLSELLSHGSLCFLYYFTTLVCNLEQQTCCSAFLWFSLLNKRQKFFCSLFYLAVKVKGVSLGLSLAVPPPNCVKWTLCSQCDPFCLLPSLFASQWALDSTDVSIPCVLTSR